MTPKKKLTSNAKNKQLLPRARRRKFKSSGVYIHYKSITIVPVFRRKPKKESR